MHRWYKRARTVRVLWNPQLASVRLVCREPILMLVLMIIRTAFDCEWCCEFICWRYETRFHDMLRFKVQLDGSTVVASSMIHISKRMCKLKGGQLSCSVVYLYMIMLGLCSIAAVSG